MHIQSRFILTIAALAFALASGLPDKVSADELKEAQGDSSYRGRSSASIQRITASGCIER